MNMSFSMCRWEHKEDLMGVLYPQPITPEHKGKVTYVTLRRVPDRLGRVAYGEYSNWEHNILFNF